VFNGEARTIVLTSNPHTQFRNAETFIIDDWQQSPLFILNALYQKEIQSVIVEGGATLLNSFIQYGLWNEARVFTGNTLFGEGVKAPTLNHTVSETSTVGNSSLSLYYNKV
jgi:diaminohydroxyphosphoribosylaminopyrimidine deaminase/5-amino-6-(5-phosphoribosylamino)uracil reductase